MTLLMLTLAHAGSTTMARLSPEEVQVATCQQSVREYEERGELERVVTLWEACLSEAKRRELSDALPQIQGQLELATLRRDHGELAEEEPLTWARMVLATVAANPEADFEMEEVQDHWLSLVRHPDARHNLSQVRSVAIRWVGSQEEDAELQERVDAHLRRFVGDMGFKVPLANSADVGEAEIVVQVQARFKRIDAREGNERGLWGAQVVLRSEAVRFRAVDAQGGAITIARRADHPDYERAAEASAEAVAQAFAEELLLEVVEVVFADYQMPAP